MKAPDKSLVLAFLLGGLAFKGVDYLISPEEGSAKDGTAQGGSGDARERNSRTPGSERRGGGGVQGNPVREKALEALSAVAGDHSAAWDEIEKSNLSQSEKDSALEWLLREMCESNRFDLGFELVTTKLNVGTRRNILIASLFGNPSIPLKNAFEAARSLPTESEKSKAMSGISVALSELGLRGCAMDAPSVLSLDQAQAASFGSGIGRHVTLMEGTREVKAGVVRDDLKYFNGLAAGAKSSREREAADTAFFNYLGMAAEIDSESSLEVLTARPIDEVSSSRPVLEAVSGAVNTLITSHPEEALAYLKSGKSHGSAQLFGSAVGLWAARDLDAASAWIESNTDNLSGPQMDSMASSLVDVSLRMGDKEGARAWQAQIKDPRLASVTAGMVK